MPQHLARQLREEGDWYTMMILGLDAYSVFSAVTANTVKVPSDSSLLAHIQYLRELLDRGVLDQLWWVDTRDMWADGLTKGVVDRDALHAAMDGLVSPTQGVHMWKSSMMHRKGSL